MAHIGDTPPARTRRGGSGRWVFSPTVTLAIWQLRQTWRLLLIIGIGIIAAVMLVCVVPLYTQVTTTAGLRSVLNASTGSSDVTVRSSAEVVSSLQVRKIQGQLDNVLAANLGPYISGPAQFSIQMQGLTVISQDPFQRGDRLQLIGASMQAVPPHVKVIQGRLPHLTSSTLEMAVTPETASDLHVKVGSTLTVQLFSGLRMQWWANEHLSPNAVLQVVGIFTPTANDVFWHGQDFQADSSDRSTLYKVLISNNALLPMLTAFTYDEQIVEQVLVKPADLVWYYHLDPARISINQLDDVQNGLNTVLVNISDNPVAPPYVENTQAYGPSADALQMFRSRLAVVQIPLVSLLILVVCLILFFVGLMTNVLVDRHADAIAILRSRGASRRQIMASLSTQSVGLGLLALVVGPQLALVVVSLLVQNTLSAADQQALNTITQDPVGAMLGVGWFAVGAVVVSLLAMIVAIFQAFRFDILARRREAARAAAERRPPWQRVRLDIIAAIIALTGYLLSAYVTSPGVLDAHTRVLILAPLTLLGTFFLVLGCVLLFLRFFPLLLQLCAELAARSRSAAPMIALAQMARTPRHAIRMTLLLALAIAFALFALVFTASQAQRIPDVAAYQVGSDFSGQIPGSDILSQVAGFARIPGVTSATVGYSGTAQFSANNRTASIEIRAVDATTYPSTVIWMAQDAPQSPASLMAQLSAQRVSATAQGIIPAIVDSTAWSTLHLGIGTQFTLTDANGTLKFTTIGRVEHIPTVSDSAEFSSATLSSGGILLDYRTYGDIAEKVNNSYIPQNVVWLRTHEDGAALASVRTSIGGGLQLLNQVSDRRAMIATLSNDPLYLALIGLLTLGAATVLVLALLGSLIVSWLNAHGRLANFAVLRALGTAPRQVAGVLTWEQCIVYVTALILGVFFGFLLAVVALPALIFTSVGSNSTLSSSAFYVLQDVPPVQVVIPYSVGIALGVLVVICTVALGMMVWVVSQPLMGQVLRVNED